MSKHNLLIKANLEVLSLLFALFTSVTAPPDTLGTAEVTATRRLTGIATTAPVQRIDSAALVQRGITDMADALRRFSGVNLRDYGGAGGLKTVSVRGLGAAHTAVTYDGLSVSDSQQGQIDLGKFSIDRLATIELQTLEGGDLLCPVRNTAAALVNLVTPSNLATDHRLHGSATLRQASFSTYAPSLMLKKRVAQRTSLNLSTDYFFARNNYPFILENGVATERLRRTNSRMQTVTTEANFSQILGRADHSGTLTAKLFFTHNYRHLPGMVRYYVNENNEQLLEQTAFGQFRWQQQFNRWNLFAAAKHNWQTSQYDDYDAQYPNGRLSQHYWQRETYTTCGAAYRFTPQWQLAYATDFALTSQNSNLVTDHRVERQTWLQSLSLGLHTRRFQLTARGIAHLYWNGMRGGGSARNAQRITPSLTATFQALSVPFWLYLRAGYKESFRLPTFTESYYYHRGSNNLQPELAHQLSAGFTLQAAPTHRWTTLALTADAYYNRITDRITSIPYNLFIWQTINVGQVRTLGLDLTLQSQWQLTARHSLLLNANYTWQSSTDHTSPTLSSWRKQLAYTPPHSGAASLTWLNPWLSLVAHVSYSSQRWATNNHLPTTQLSAYADCGLAVFRHFTLRQLGKLELRADLINALNERYEVIRRYPMPGRSYKLSAKLEF